MQSFPPVDALSLLKVFKQFFCLIWKSFLYYAFLTLYTAIYFSAINQNECDENLRSKLFVVHKIYVFIYPFS